MHKLTYENSNGGKVTLGAMPPFVLKTFSGINDISVDIQRQKAPFQDGSTQLDSLLEEREIPVQFAILTNSYSDLLNKRKLIGSVFNPKLEGKLIYEHGDFTREIRCWVDSGPSYPAGDDRGYTHQTVSVDLLALDPFWTSGDLESDPAFTSLFQFPFEGAFEMGLQQETRILLNEGDVPTPLIVEFNGPALNPQITKTSTGEFIKVNRELQEGEKLVVDTTRGSLSVMVDDGSAMQNVFNWIDLDSTFFYLDIGENEIDYSADSDISGAIVDMYFRNQYIGV